MLKTAGLQSITATDSANGLSVTGSAVTVQPAAANSLKLTGFPSAYTIGAQRSVTVTAYDAYGNVASGYAGTVDFTSSDNRALLPSNYTFTAGDGGSHSFPVTFETVGSQSIIATDTATTSITGTESAISVQPTPMLKVTSSTSATTAGQALIVTVTAYYASGAVAAGYTGTVQFGSSDSRAVLPTNYTFNASDGGMHTFSVVFETAGTQSITVADTLVSTVRRARIRDQRPSSGSPDAEDHRFPIRSDCRDVKRSNGHGLRFLWKRGDRLYRYRKSFKLRQSGDFAGRIYFQRQRCRHTHL